ncbi:MAG TPA: ATP-binding protein [Dokdonella sp.]|nr:ATP-binding protein [Dokdonella sp.]
MKLRLWQRLFLTFAALSSLVLAAFVFWQQQTFRRGFLGYLDEVALERLQPVTRRLATAYADNAGWSFLRGDERQFADLIEPDLRRAMRAIAPAKPPRGDNGRPHWSPPGFDDRSRPPHRDGPPTDEFDDDRPSPDPRRHSRAMRAHLAELNLLSRLLLVDRDGVPVIGDPGIRSDASSLPIEVDGNPVGTLYLRALPQLRGDTDLAFARDQLRNALIASIAVLALALLLAFALARWLLDPVRELAAGTRALAAGDYARRVADARGDELGALAQDFNHLASTLEQHREARRRWAADIAHELRTPLSILRGEIQALQDGVRSSTPAALASLQAECERMGSLIEDLYQLSLADAGALEYRFEELDLVALVEDSLEARQRGFEEAGLQVEKHVEPIPLVRGDARRLGQLIDNLLVNTLRYTDAPGRVRVSLASEPGAILLRVEDSAPAVPVESLPLLFDRLYRVDASRNRAAGGAGLGLAICQAIVVAHGGRIEATASALGGVRISAWFPASGSIA